MQGQKEIQELIAFLVNQINELKQVVEGLKTENECLKSKLEDYQTQKNSNILNPFSFSGILKMLFFSLTRQIIQA